MRLSFDSTFKKPEGIKDGKTDDALFWEYFCRFIVTCGNDGDVRIWEGLDDDDPKFITVGEKVYSLALKVCHWGGCVYNDVSQIGARLIYFTGLSSAEREAGNGELQQHRADAHVS